MDITKYVIVQAIQTKANELIPIWDNRLYFNTSAKYGDGIEFKNNMYYSTVECIFDIETKTLTSGIELEYFPPTSELKFNLGDSVLYEVQSRKLREDVISDIIFKNFNLTIRKGNELDRYYINKFPIISTNLDAIYSIKEYSPIYVLSDGTEVNGYALYTKL